jgi:hypothetical protein
MLNSNAAHNFLNFLGLIVGSLIAFDWAGLGLPPATAAAIASGVLIADKVIKLAINVLRDGFGGLFKPQPPVIK